MSGPIDSSNAGALGRAVTIDAAGRVEAHDGAARILRDAIERGLAPDELEWAESVLAGLESGRLTLSGDAAEALHELITGGVVSAATTLQTNHPDWQTNAESRREILEQLAQLDNNSSTRLDSSRCGPSCIVAAAFARSGRDGVLALVNEARGLANTDPKKLDQIERHANGGTLTLNHLHLLQDELCAGLWVDEEVPDPENPGRTRRQQGVGDADMRRFINQPSIAEHFGDAEIVLLRAATTGDSDHWVLKLSDAEYYDPGWAFAGGSGHLHTEPEVVGQFRKHEVSFGVRVVE